MEDIKLNLSDIYRYIIIFNVALGILFGSLPLIAGMLLKNKKLGLIGLVLSVVGGALLGVFLSYPISAIFVYLIAKRPAGADETVRADL